MLVALEEKYHQSIRETSFLQQTAYWAQVKQKQGMTPKAFHLRVKDRFSENGKHEMVAWEDELLLLLQYPDQDHSIAYVPYGPGTEPREDLQGLILEELSEALRSHLPRNCILVRYDLPWESHWAKDEDWYDPDDNWLGPPDKKNQEFRFNFNTEKWKLVKANTDILPSNTLFIDLKQNPDKILSQMRAKTRYNVRLSFRKGVEVHISGLEDLDVWQSLYRQTARRNQLYLHQRAYFEEVLKTARQSDDPTAKVHLLLAEKQGKPLAAMFLAISGKRATYLYGASSSENRNSMATYALQWEAMKLAKKSGCSEYDLFGVAPYPDPRHPMFGLYRFKSGFGGRMYHRMGCWDYPIKDQAYKFFQASEITAPGYHLNA